MSGEVSQRGVRWVWWGAVGAGVIGVLVGQLFIHTRILRYSETRLLMGTVVQIDVCAPRADSEDVHAAQRAVWGRLREIEDRMSVFREGSDIFRLNHAQGQAITVSPDTYAVLASGQRYWGITRGTFDITVMPLVTLWKQAGRDGLLPSAEKIAVARGFLGAADISFLSDEMVRLGDASVQVDLGGIAKGYAADEAARILRSQGFADFYVDVGGNLYVGARNCDGGPWRIGIRDPRNKDAIIDTIVVRNSGISTSGDYERYVEINGERYSHIIDPRSGYPATEVISATVIAPDAMDADAVSTALCVLPSQEGLALIDNLGPAYAAFLVSAPDGVLDIHGSRQYTALRDAR